MTINKHRSLWYALLGSCCLTLVDSVPAQQDRLPPAVVGQMVDELLSRVVPPNESLSRVSVGRRKIIFDGERTIAAFGYPAGSISFTDLGLKSAVTQSSRAVLENCDFWGRHQCTRLGWRVYVWIEPVTVTKANAFVRVHIIWADRDASSFKEGVPPTGRAVLLEMVKQVELARSGMGRWNYVKEGPTLVS